MPAVLSAVISTPAPVNSTTEKLVSAHEAIEALATQFVRVARRLAPKDRFRREDLVQEMNLSCLGVRAPMPVSYFFTRAVNDALNALAHEKRHERLKFMPNATVCAIADSRR